MRLGASFVVIATARGSWTAVDQRALGVALTANASQRGPAPCAINDEVNEGTGE